MQTVLDQLSNFWYIFFFIASFLLIALYALYENPETRDERRHAIRALAYVSIMFYVFTAALIYYPQLPFFASALGPLPGFILLLLILLPASAIISRTVFDRSVSWVPPKGTSKAYEMQQDLIQERQVLIIFLGLLISSVVAELFLDVFKVSGDSFLIMECASALVVVTILCGLFWINFVAFRKWKEHKSRKGK